jgi:hypothetical protein
VRADPDRTRLVERVARARDLAATLHRAAGICLLAVAGCACAVDPLQAIPQPYRSVASGRPVVPYGVGTGARRDADGSPLLPPLHWEVSLQDRTLARTLERWGAQAGYRVRWEAQREVPIAAADSYEGTFEAALQSVLRAASARRGEDALEVCIYADMPPVARITRRGEQARECTGP